MESSQLPTWQILIIDDDEDDYLLTLEMLNQARGRKIKLDWAPTYAAGQQKLTHNRYDAILVDYDLGEKTGIELIAQFAAQDFRSPLILYTGRGSYEVDLEAMQAGATLYLTKAETSPAELERSIRYAIERKQIEMQLRESAELLEKELAVRGKVEQALAASHTEVVTERNRLLAMMEALPIGVAILDANGGNLQTNQRFEQMWGSPRPAVEKIEDYRAYKAWWAIDGSPLVPEDWASARAIQEGETVVGQSLKIERMDGSVIYVSNSAAPIFGMDGRVVGSVVAMMDVTQNRLAEEKLRASEQKFSLIFQKAAFAASLSILPDGILVDVNEAWERQFEYTRQEAIGKTTVDLKINLNLEAREHTLAQIKRQGWVHDQNATLYTRSGKTHSFIINIDTVEIDHQKYLLNTALDITESERVKAELQGSNRRLEEQAEIMAVQTEELRLQAEELKVQADELAAANQKTQDQEKELRLILDTAPALISYVDVDFRYIWVNKGYERWFNLSADEMRGKFVWQVLGLPSFTSVKPFMKRALAGEQVVYELQNPYQYGGPRWIRASLTPDRDSSGRVRGFVGHVVDIGDIKRAEVELQAAEENRKIDAAVEGERKRFLDVLETLPTMICLLTPDYHVSFANRSFRQRFGESQGRHCYEYCYSRNEPCDFCESYKVLQTGLPHHWEINSGDGTVIECHDFPFTDLDGSPMILEMDWDVTEHRRMDWELARQREHLAELVKERTASLEDANAHLQVEIDERNRANEALQAFTDQLRRTNQALESFTGIVSHDLQEPLRKIKGFGDLLLTKYSPALGDEGQDYVTRMQQASHRMQDMLDGLLAYSRITSQGSHFVPVNLNQIVEEVLSDLELRRLQTSGQVGVDPLPVIEADPLQIRQLFQNMIGNALKFHRPDVPPQVKVTSRTEGDNVVLVISDNGIGFEPKSSEFLFKPFHRLHKKGEYEGSGMGLAICSTIVERHGGSITATSTPGEGSTFLVTLPQRHSA